MKRFGLPVTLALSFLVLGFVFIAFAWNGAAEKDSIQEQFPYVISGGIAGLGFVGLGVALLLFEAGRRLSTHLDARLDALTEALQATAARAAEPVTETPKLTKKAAETAAMNGRVVVGRASFHRPDCRLVSTKDEADFATPAEAIARGLQPCRVCDPTTTPVGR